MTGLAVRAQRLVERDGKDSFKKLQNLEFPTNFSGSFFCVHELTTRGHVLPDVWDVSSEHTKGYTTICQRPIRLPYNRQNNQSSAFWIDHNFMAYGSCQNFFFQMNKDIGAFDNSRG